MREVSNVGQVLFLFCKKSISLEKLKKASWRAEWGKGCKYTDIKHIKNYHSLEIMRVLIGE
jgi:hypothetical protein